MSGDRSGGGGEEAGCEGADLLRLEGTNVEEGRKILKESGLKFQVGATMKEAAELAVAAAKGGKV